MLLTTTQAAERLNCSRSYIQKLCRSHALPYTKIGRDYLIDERDLASVTVGPAHWPKGKRRPAKHGARNE